MPVPTLATAVLLPGQADAQHLGRGSSINEGPSASPMVSTTCDLGKSSDSGKRVPVWGYFRVMGDGGLLEEQAIWRVESLFRVRNLLLCMCVFFLVKGGGEGGGRGGGGISPGGPKICVCVNPPPHKKKERKKKGRSLN